MAEYAPETTPGSSDVAQQRRIAILSNSDRETRLERISAIVHRPVDSSKELSYAEAQAVIRTFERWL